MLDRLTIERIDAIAGEVQRVSVPSSSIMRSALVRIWMRLVPSRLPKHSAFTLKSRH